MSGKRSAKMEVIRVPLRASQVESLRSLATFRGESLGCLVRQILDECAWRESWFRKNSDVDLTRNRRLQFLLRGSIAERLMEAAQRCRLSVSSFVRRLVVEADIDTIRKVSYVYGAVSMRPQLFDRDGDGKGKVLYPGIDWEVPNQQPTDEE